VSKEKKHPIMMGLRLAAALAVGVFLATPAAATPITITFENASANSDYIPDGYGGVDWDNFGGHSDYVGGYHTGIVSGSWTGFNLFGDPASITHAGGFNLYDGYFTGAWRDNMVFAVLGYRNGIQIYGTAAELDASGPKLISFNFIDVDLVRFFAFGGVNSVPGGDGTTFVVDNLRLEVAQTPIPAALPLFASALGGLGFVGWRRKRRVPGTQY
jgi:hypothetical protein